MQCINPWNSLNSFYPDYYSDDFIIFTNVGKRQSIEGVGVLQYWAFNQPYKVNSSTIILCLEGSFDIEIDSIRYTVGKNHILVILPKQTIKSYKPSDDFDGHVTSISNNFSEIREGFKRTTSLFLSLRSHPLAQISDEEVDLLNIYYTLLGKKAKDNENLLRDVTIQYLVQAVFFEFCRLLLKHIDTRNYKYLSHKEETFEKFLKLVEECHNKERDISFYAGKLSLTPKYLSSLVRDVSGKLAGDWIEEYVIMEAKALLVSSDMNIQEICYELNFPTPSCFTRYFKRITGVTPSKFKTRMKYRNSATTEF